MEQRELNTDAVKSAELVDAWLDGFIKECEHRGVDAERLLSVIIRDQENKQENK